MSKGLSQKAEKPGDAGNHFLLSPPKKRAGLARTHKSTAFSIWDRLGKNIKKPKSPANHVEGKGRTQRERPCEKSALRSGFDARK